MVDLLICLPYSNRLLLTLYFPGLEIYHSVSPPVGITNAKYGCMNPRPLGTEYLGSLGTNLRDLYSFFIDNKPNWVNKKTHIKQQYNIRDLHYTRKVMFNYKCIYISISWFQICMYLANMDLIFATLRIALKNQQ